MTVRLRLAAVGVIVLTLAGCATEAPDYQSVWSTSAAPAPTTTTAAEAPQGNIATFLETAGVIGDPVAPDRLTDITITCLLYTSPSPRDS